MNVPHVERREGGATNVAVDWHTLDETLKTAGVANLDEALKPDVLKALHEYFMEATVWYTSRAGGAFVKAQLRDGLHVELLLQIAAEISAHLPNTIGAHHLVDIFAHKYDAEWPGSHANLPAHTLPAAVVVGLWVVPTAASLDPAGNGWEIFNATAPTTMQVQERFDLAQQVEASARGRDATFPSTRVPYQQNRLVAWRADRLFRMDWRRQNWRAGYRHRRVDLWFLFGNPPEAKTSIGVSARVVD